MSAFKQLNKKADLTRWNRAGLKQFRYIDGNAITYLEALRQELVEQYNQGGAVQWDELLSRFPDSPNETLYQTKKRLNGQYYDDRRDYAWEILRTFSRSLHILGEYIDAYANEAYLPTAVEWDNVRKLVALLDYRPSPPASAETYIALLFKEGESGEVDKGFAVKNKPGKGESTVIFETQEKLEGSANINQLHLKDWNKNVTPLRKRVSIKSSALKSEGVFIKFYLADEVADDINVGDEGVIATPTQGFPIQVSAISSDIKGDFLSLKSSEESAIKGSIKGFTLNNTTLYLQPDFVSSPLPNGVSSVKTSTNLGVAKGDVVFTEKNGVVTARKVKANKHGVMEFEGLAPEKGEVVTRTKILRSQALDKEIQLGNSASEKVTNLFVFPKETEKSNIVVMKEDLSAVSPDEIKSASIKKGNYYYIDNNAKTYGNKLYFADKAQFKSGNQKGDSVAKARIEEVGTSVVEKLEFAGKPNGLEYNQWCLVSHKPTKKGETKTRTAYLISSINTGEETFSVNLKGSTRPVSLLRSAFKLTLQQKDHDVNQSSVGHRDSVAGVTILELESASLAENFKPSQKVICASGSNALSTDIKDVVGARLYVSAVLDRGQGFTRHNTLIYGNVARATHGETQPEKIVGNGDASQVNQCFQLASDSISWVADASYRSGVRADLILRVGQRVWQQVQDLSLSAPEDHHYMVKVNEDNKLTVCFGDGKHGRRLPTGIDNIRVRYRNGYGEEGNLEANALLKIARPHSLIDDFVAPLPAAGGAEKETSASMRESAPATVLALSRAVSLDDFTHLAAHHSMVWQAKAFEKMPDRPARSQIEVVVVAAGGSVFEHASDTAKLIESFLVSHAAPATPVSVKSYKPLMMQLKVSIMVDEAAYDRKQVARAVREYLQVELDIKKRKLGQALLRSEVIALLEQVEGVENGHCEILSAVYENTPAIEKPRLHRSDDGEIRKVSIKPDQLLYLDSKQYPLQVVSQDYKI